MERRDVALQAAVGLDGDEAALRAEALALGGDDFEVLGVYFGHDHGHVGGPAVGAVVGDDGALELGVGLLEGDDLLLLHIHGGEDEIHLRGDGLHVADGVLHDDGLGAFGHGDVDGPAGADGVLIGLSGAAGAGGDDRQVEPGMPGEQGDETLPHHAGAADDADFELVHGS